MRVGVVGAAIEPEGDEGPAAIARGQGAGLCLCSAARCVCPCRLVAELRQCLRLRLGSSSPRIARLCPGIAGPGPGRGGRAGPALGSPRQERAALLGTGACAGDREGPSRAEAAAVGQGLHGRSCGVGECSYRVAIADTVTLSAA